MLKLCWRGENKEKIILNACLFEIITGSNPYSSGSKDFSSCTVSSTSVKSFIKATYVGLFNSIISFMWPLNDLMSDFLCLGSQKLMTSIKSLTPSSSPTQSPTFYTRCAKVLCFSYGNIDGMASLKINFERGRLS
jgi:hypothetical protein